MAMLVVLVVVVVVLVVVVVVLLVLLVLLKARRAFTMPTCARLAFDFGEHPLHSNSK